MSDGVQEDPLSIWMFGWVMIEDAFVGFTELLFDVLCTVSRLFSASVLGFDIVVMEDKFKDLRLLKKNKKISRKRCLTACCTHLHYSRKLV
jgi:hypothetical protein